VYEEQISSPADIPGIKLFVVLRQSASKIIDVNIDPGSVTITYAGTDVRLTGSKEVRTQSPYGVLANIGGALIHRSAKQKSANQLITVEDKSWDGVIRSQLIRWRFID